MAGFYTNDINCLSKPHRGILLLLTGLMLLLLVSCDLGMQEQNNKSAVDQQIQRTLDTLLEACWNSKEINKLELVMTDNVSRRVNNIVVGNNLKEVAANITVFASGFPDLHIDLSNLHITDNYAFYNWTFSGTNTGVFGEFPATGKKIKVNGMSKVEFNEEGKIVMEDVSYNELDLLQQLGYTLKPPNFE